ncbi:hypothetical protein AAVH_37368 [Aphelenchoides avenae]|nr:hypothetical protein AAVH_37368 [Aphelenchus avenae]
MELAAAYSYCHSPEAMVTHLDAHSRNILYVNDGGRIRLWLTDFGLSKGYTDPHDQRFINDKYTDIHAVGEFYFQLVYGKVGKRGVDEKLRSKRLCQKDEDYFRREKLYRGAVSVNGYI